jgi:hypothetical protein
MIFTTTLVIAPALALAQGGMMGGMMSMAGGGGMMVVADDGSLLVTETAMDGMMGGDGPGSGFALDRELINIGPDGVERWRTSFDDGWPMRPVTDGDLVVLTLVDGWWAGLGDWGDLGWWLGGDGPMSGGLTLVGLDLASGAELWRTELDGGMGAMPLFAPDGSQLYVSLRSLSFDGDFGGPMHQGDGFGAFMSTTITALDRSGTVLWTLELGDDHMGGGQSSWGPQ